MARLSLNPKVQSLRGPGGTKFVPFTVYARIIPFASESRFEVVRSREEIANQAEEALEDIQDGTNSASERFDFAFPIKSTPQFGDETARITVNGNVTDVADFTKTPLEEVLVINAGEFKRGFAAGRAPNRVPSTALNDAVKELKDLIESATGLLVYKIDMAGFIFGKDGRHFPV